MLLFNKIVSVLLLSFSLSFHPKVTVMSYNVENLFDNVDNGTEYKEYDPGRGKWNSELFYKKLASISRVIKASSKKGPDIIALQEVENKNTLNKLVEGYLKNMNYNYIVIVPKSRLAANVGIISRYPVKQVHSYYVSSWGEYPVRNILEADISVNGRLLYLFDNHWKSKSGGKAVTEISRREAARVLIKRLKEIHTVNPNADIVVCGDFNDDIDEYITAGKKYETAFIPAAETVPEEYFKSSIFLSGIPEKLFVSSRIILYDPWYELIRRLNGKDVGSYVYRRKWETPDHILLSYGLFDNKGLTYEPGNFRVMKNSFLLSPDTGYPKRWSFVKSREGYSDHLPLIIVLEQR